MGGRVYHFEVDEAFDGRLATRYPVASVSHERRRVTYVDTEDFALARRGRAHGISEGEDGATAFDDSESLVGLTLARSPDGDPPQSGPEAEPPHPDGSSPPTPDESRPHAAAPATDSDGLAARLRPAFTAEIERRRRWLRPGGSLEIELVTETVVVVSALQRRVLHRCEVLCLSGRGDRYLRWLRALSRAHELRLEIDPPARIGLAALQAPVPPLASARHRPPECWPQQRVSLTAAAAVRACLAQIVDNAGPILQGEDPEGPHQFRVGLRRLRAQLRLFELASREPQWNSVTLAARELATLVGGIRECDVFEQEHLAPLRKAIPGDLALWGLADGLARLRSRRRIEARARLSSPSFCRFVLNVEYLCAQLEQSPTETALADYARHRLHELDARLKRRVDAAHDAATWHRARLAAKDLRYALEAIAPAVEHPSRTRKAVAVMTRLQDELGRLQDRRDSLGLARTAADEYLMDGHMRSRAEALVDGWIAAQMTFDAGSAQQAAEHLKRGRRLLRALISRKRRVGQ